MALLQLIVPAMYTVSMAVLLVYALNLYWLSIRLVGEERLLPGRPADDRDPVVRPWPRVTVQLPVYNEALVVERLIDACSRLDYPRRLLEIQVLDDSSDVTSELISRRVDALRHRGLDIMHVRRAARDGFKAGALANGLRFASGDFVAIFDADFVPAADFLRRIIPHFDAPDVGLVPARWDHLNGAHSALTRIQAFGLDTHFAIEQKVRAMAGCFVNFNGTAGVWRRSCIEDAGGWSAETLTEDLDLSYRAQLSGWRLKYVHELDVPAELPAVTGAFRSQQFRWSKGSMQTAIRLLPAVWRSSRGAGVKIEATLHLTAHLVFPLVLLAGMLHVPLVLMKHTGVGPDDMYFALLGFGLFGLAGFFLAQLFAQRSLYPDWRSRLRLFPLFMAVTMGLSVNNTRAVLQALRGRPSPFVRTPKSGEVRSSEAKNGTSYADTRISGVVWAEAAALLYSLVGLVAVVAAGEWMAAPFQLLLVCGFGLIVWFSLADYLRRDTRSTDSHPIDGIDRAGYLGREYSKSVPL